MARRRENLEKIVESQSPYHVEQWYPALVEHTFPTTWFPLTAAQARAIITFRDSSTLTSTGSRKLRSMKVEAEAALRAPLTALAAQIDAASARLGGGPFFCRLSSRSPKDAALTNGRLFELYQNELASLSTMDTAVAEQIAFTRSCSMVLQSKTGEDTIDLFLSSQRVYEDIKMALELHGDEKFCLQVVVRKWECALRAEWEFRCFVYGGQLRACTQYYSECYVPALSASRLAVQQRIQSFFDATKHLVTVPDYTIDYALDAASERVWIVEINNPPPVAGQALFDYDTPEDRKIMEEGPFEMRVLQLPRESAGSSHDLWWQYIRDRQKQASLDAALGGGGGGSSCGSGGGGGESGSAKHRIATRRGSM